MIRLWAVGLVGALASVTAVAAGSAPAPAAVPERQADFFETKVRPVLFESCVKCHGPAKQLGGLRLDSREAMLKGGGRGAALAPGDPARSLLVQAVTYTHASLRMPPARQLPAADVAALTTWVKQGAPWPSYGPAAAAPGALWSLRPVGRPPLPRVKNAAWVRNPIDAFVLARLEKQGMAPAPPADPRTLIRRVTFDLTGLPPTPDEVEAFVRECTAERALGVGSRALGVGAPALGPGHRASGTSSGGGAAQAATGNGGDHAARLPRRGSSLGAAPAAPPPGSTPPARYPGGQRSPSPDAGPSHTRAPGSTPTHPYTHTPAHAPTAYERLVDRLLASPRYGERWARYWLDLVRYADTNGYERDAEKKHSWKYRDYVIRSLNEDKPYDRFLTEQLAGDELPDRSEETVTATGFLRLGTWDDEPNDALEYRYERLDDLVHATATTFMGLTVKCARCHDHKFDPIPQKDYYAFGAAFYGGYLEGGVMGGPPDAALPYPVLGFTDKGKEAPPLHLLEKGDPRREGEVVEPGFLSAIPLPGAPPAPLPTQAGTTGRRLRLARWLADPAHPLTARVFVNRLWQHHFGTGLVHSANNFGVKGDRPTHPELLDYLAWLFSRPATPGGEGMGVGVCGCMGVENPVPAARSSSPSAGKAASGVVQRSHLPVRTTPTHPHTHTPTRPHSHTSTQGLGWSPKKLHRLIVLSNAYRMASVHPREAAYRRKDFANDLLWRQNRRRLDADALRDAMLAVSGDLNLQEGGPGFVPTVQREALEGLSRKGAEWLPSAPEEQRRRTVYMFLKRALLMPLLTVFDFPDTTQPVEARDSTLVAPQALALLNNPFVHEQADALARRVAAGAGPDPARRVNLAWQLAFGRMPAPTERDAAVEHLRIAAAAAKRDARVPAPLPGEIPLQGLSMRLRADRGVTLDGDGRVSAWTDESPAGHDAGQPDAAARPLLATGALNGKPLLRFDGKGRFLRLAGQVLSSQQYTLFAVVNDAAPGTNHREIFSNWTAAFFPDSFFFGLTGRSIRLTDHFSPAGAISQPEKHFILTGVSGAAGAVLYQDRREAARRQAPIPRRKLDTPYVIGQQGNINGEFWNGDLAELLVYDRELSDAEREQVWDTLSHRYGIAVRPPAPDPALASLCRVLLNSNEFIYVD